MASWSRRIVTYLAFDYQWDGAHWNHDGLLIEEQRTNLISNTSNVTNTVWTTFGGASINDGGTLALDGVSPAWKYTPNTSNNPHNFFFVYNAMANSTPYTSSIYAKAGTQHYVTVQIEGNTDGTHFATAIFDLTDGQSVASQTANAAAGVAILRTAKYPVGSNGWFRLELTASANTDGTAYVVYGIASAANGNALSATGEPAYAAAGTETAWFAFPQFEAGNSATSFIPSAGAATTRAIDNLTLTVGSSAETAYTGNAASVILDLTDAKSNWANFMFPSSGVGVAPLYFNPNANGTANVGTYTIPDELDTTNVLSISALKIA
jgi:VCBS repeat-containing protein